LFNDQIIIVKERTSRLDSVSRVCRFAKKRL